MASRALNSTEFASLVNSITSAFGDPTRRNIYLLLRDHGDGLTTNETAAAVGIHTNVARHHLEKLVNANYVEVGRQNPENSGPASAGRPAKVYRATHQELPVEFGIGHDDILITLLGKALARLPESEAAAMAEEVGIEFGRKMAERMGPESADSQRSFRSALHVVADALSSHGFAAHAEQEGDELTIVSGHCPFGDVAIEHPVICAVDRGMVQGMLGSLYGTTEVELSASVAQGDDACITEIAAPPSPS